MAISFQKEETSFEVPDEDIYTLRFVGVISTREFENRNDPAGPKDVSMYCQFVIDDPESDWDGTEVRAYYPMRVTSGNKTGKLFAAMFGGQLPEHKFDEDDLIGRKFRATVKKNEKGYPEIEAPLAVRQKRGRGAESTPSVDATASLGVPGVDEPGF